MSSSAVSNDHGGIGEAATPAAVAKKLDVLICMYGGLPEPPTLNAILVMSDHFRCVTFLRNNLICPQQSYFVIPQLVEIGSGCDSRAAQTKGNLWKLARFTRYCCALLQRLRKHRYAVVVVHDDLALLAFWLVRKFARYTGLAWFNSYDVIDTANVPLGRFSLFRLVVAKQEALFSVLDFFSLPTADRRGYYPIHKVRRETFVIPNFPALGFYKRFARRRSIGKPIKLIYQGALGRGHGFEEVIRFLRMKVHGSQVELTLKGWIIDAYRDELKHLAFHSGVSDKLSFASFGPYRSVPELASTCHVGLAIFTGRDVMNQTLGTASNKIYEYAALGLPVILYDSPHFRDRLGNRRWAFFTDLTETSLHQTLCRIIDEYDDASCAAIDDFIRELHFEKAFTPALDTVIGSIPRVQHVEP